MTYENFEKHIEFIKDRRTLNNKVGKIMGDYFDCWVMLEGDYEDEYVKLLEEVMNDNDTVVDGSGWISYWIYELDFGKKAKKDTVTDNGKNIPIKTIKDLYRLITNEKDN